MARLNEPAVDADSLETLRRRFLRQNRDIARINSTQSLRIRSLENECARLLSENLDLRGQVLRLEADLQESQAHRIADHALEIKEKMEAQLLEWGAMLASLGNEPVPKNRSPRASKKARISSSPRKNSPVLWKRREPKNVDPAAQQEGRLPPIWENKSFPRETLNREEIIALCSEAAEDTESPDLGPPPMSRFVDQEPVKIDLLSKASQKALSSSKLLENKDSRPGSTASCESVTKKDAPPQQTAKPAENVSATKEAKPAKATKSAAHLELNQDLKISLKRKTRDDDEKENASAPSGELGKSTKDHPLKDIQRPVSRPIKEIVPGRGLQPKPSSIVTAAGQRKPLSIRNTNESIKSPRKATKPSIPDDTGKPRSESKPTEDKKQHLKKPAQTREVVHNDKQPKEQAEPNVPALVPVEIPITASPDVLPIATIEIDPEALAVETHIPVPDSPEPLVAREELCDTPPPVDISSKGETTRGSRRARTSVSYAEPNLRDKMRRPSKQLFDAVAGETKYMRRASQSKGGELLSAPSSAVKDEVGPSSLSNSSTALEYPDSPKAHTLSPLAKKTSELSLEQDRSEGGSNNKKKRGFSLDARERGAEAGGADRKPAPKPANRRLEEIAAREQEVAKLFDESDIYEFPSTSVDDDSRSSLPEVETKKSSNRRQSRSRRLSSVVREDLALDDAEAAERQGKAAGKKRASMAAPRKTRMEELCADTDSPSSDGSLYGSSPADNSGSAQARTSVRRKSTML